MEIFFARVWGHESQQKEAKNVGVFKGAGRMGFLL
jgi:hypothetical protein